MTDNDAKIVQKLEKILGAHVKTYCRAIAFQEVDSKETSIAGYVVNDKYFVDEVNNKIFKKSDLYLVNYMDETDD